MVMDNESYKKLKKKWYKKLRDSGFVDIEAGQPPNDKYFRTRLKNNASATLHYFRLARNFYSHYNFASNSDQALWFWHSEGASMRQIIKKYRKKFKKSMSVYWVHTQIHRLIKEMYRWNQEHPEGIREEWEEDPYKPF